MSTEVIVALITTGGIVLIALGAGAKFIISTIIAAYKHQASQTVDAKDAEIARLRGQVLDEIEAVRDGQLATRAQVGELRQDVAALRLDWQRRDRQR